MIKVGGGGGGVGGVWVCAYMGINCVCAYVCRMYVYVCAPMDVCGCVVISSLCHCSADCPPPPPACCSGSQRKVLSDADLLICLGGDGTLLYAASLFEVCVCVCACMHECVCVYIYTYVYNYAMQMSMHISSRCCIPLLPPTEHGTSHCLPCNGLAGVPHLLLR